MVAPSSSTVVITQLLQFYVITEAELEANFDISVLQFTRYQYKKKKTIINTLKILSYTFHKCILFSNYKSLDCKMKF